MVFFTVYFTFTVYIHIQFSLPFAGAEKELGGGAQGVPVPLGLHRFHTEEDTQAEAGRRNEATGTRHWCHRKAQDYLYCQ